MSPSADAATLQDVPAPSEYHSVIALLASKDPREVIVVIDDDPTGSQSVRGLPLLTRWTADDLRWALQQNTPGIYVLTNSRSMLEPDAVQVTRDVVRSVTAAAEECGRKPVFVSRSDSTLRGHFPAETDTIVDSTKESTSGVILIPAFPAAGRLTLHGMHYLKVEDTLIPVAETEFARDATFGFDSSYLPSYVEEKTAGRFTAEQVLRLDIQTVRAGIRAIADRLASARDAVPIVADVVDEHDLILIALGVQEAESRGQRFVYRVGPAFVRARLGQEPAEPVAPGEIAFDADTAPNGLVVVGSHTALTTAQLGHLRNEYSDAVVVEIPVENLREASPIKELQRDCVDRIVEALPHSHVILQTSRTLIKFDDPEASLNLSRQVSRAIVNIIADVVEFLPPKFVVAKGGITSHDVAAHGMSISRAMIVGPMLPGIISLLRPVSGPAAGIPYVVFPGNVGGEKDLLTVVSALSAHSLVD